MQPCGIRVTHKSWTTFRAQLCRPKGRVNRFDKMNVVYEISCQDCDANYVGQTSKRLATWLMQHQQAVARGDELSLVVAHYHNLHHTFAWENTAVKASAPGRASREILIAWLSDTQSINHHVDLQAAY